MNRILCFLLALTLSIGPAWANFDITTGTGTHVFAIDSANQGTSLCAASSTECPATVLIDKSGAPAVVNGNGTALETNSAPVTTPLTIRSTDPCYLGGGIGNPVNKQTVPFSTTNGVFPIVSQASLLYVYVCALPFALAASSNVSIIEGLNTALTVTSITGGIMTISGPVNIVAAGTGYTASASGTETWTGSGCSVNPVVNVTTNSSGQMSSASFSSGVCTPGSWPTTATTWTPSGIGSGTGAEFSFGNVTLPTNSWIYSATSGFPTSVNVTTGQTTGLTFAVTASGTFSGSAASTAPCTSGSPLAMVGSTIAANGMPLQAGLNGFGTGGFSVIRMITSGHGLCLEQSTTNNLIAGSLSFVQQ